MQGGADAQGSEGATTTPAVAAFKSAVGGLAFGTALLLLPFLAAVVPAAALDIEDVSDLGQLHRRLCRHLRLIAGFGFNKATTNSRYLQ